MKVIRATPRGRLGWKRPVAAIGIFDGVHRGHQAILSRAVRRARAIGGTPVALTFFPHPLAVLRPSLCPEPLYSLEERLKQFEALGIRGVWVLSFTRAFSRIPPDRFVREFLVGRLGVREVVIGHDFGFGRGRAGTVPLLRALGRQHGFSVHRVGPVRSGGRRIASAGLRRLLRAGRVREAARWLGRPYRVTGTVVRGAGRGRKLTVPTANLPKVCGLLPAPGVYAVRSGLSGRLQGGMANIGFQPTFHRSAARRRPLLEVHLFGPQPRLTGARLSVAFLERLRPERRFPSAAALKGQMVRDARRAGRILGLQGGRQRGRITP